MITQINSPHDRRRPIKSSEVASLWGDGDRDSSPKEVMFELSSEGWKEWP